MPNRIMQTEAWTEHQRYTAAAVTFPAYPDSVRDLLWRESNGQSTDERGMDFTLHINRIAERLRERRLAELDEEAESKR